MAEQGLFTPYGFQSPDEIRRRIGRAGRQDDFAYASLPAGRGMVAAARQGGRGLGGLFNAAIGKKDEPTQQKEFFENITNDSRWNPKDDLRGSLIFAGEKFAENGDMGSSIALLERVRQMDEVDTQQGIEKYKARTGSMNAETKWNDFLSKHQHRGAQAQYWKDRIGALRQRMVQEKGRNALNAQKAQMFSRANDIIKTLYGKNPEDSDFKTLFMELESIERFIGRPITTLEGSMVRDETIDNFLDSVAGEDLGSPEPRRTIDLTK